MKKLTLVPDARITNKAGAAAFFQVTLPTLNRWIREGMPVVEEGSQQRPWKIDLAAAAEWRYAPRLADGRVDPESLTPGDRKLWYDGETRRRELQVRDRQLIPAEEVEETVAVAFSAVAQSLLALPDNLERRAGLSPEQSESCERAIHEIMNDLADRLARVSPNLEGA